MPRKPMDYSKTIIYKIVSKDLSLTSVYVGHTTNFTKRKAEHKSSCYTHNYKNTKLCRAIKDNGGWENWSMLQIEVYKCCNKREAEMRERYFEELLQATLNSTLPILYETDYQEKIVCSCGSIIKPLQLRDHLNTRKHLKSNKT